MPFPRASLSTGSVALFSALELRCNFQISLSGHKGVRVSSHPFFLYTCSNNADVVLLSENIKYSVITQLCIIRLSQLYSHCLKIVVRHCFAVFMSHFRLKDSQLPAPVSTLQVELSKLGESTPFSRPPCLQASLIFRVGEVYFLAFK